MLPLVIYPIFFSDVSSFDGIGASFRIININGQLLLENPIEGRDLLQKVNVSGISDGMYFLQLVSNGRVMAVCKFVKM